MKRFVKGFMKGFLNWKAWACGLIVGFILSIFLFGCNDKLHDRGIVREKFIEKIDIQALFDSFKIVSTEADSKYQELYVIKIRGSEDKIYINQFCYEDTEIGEEIVFFECSDIRFEKEY